jgi:asparagine synthase (glutamine-hydrolysing)
MLSPRIVKVMYEIRNRKLTYLSDARLQALSEQCLANERSNVPGIIIESGCALGGSSILLCASKARERLLFIYDVFETIPPPSDKDGKDVHERYAVIKSGKSKGIDGDRYYGYTPNLLGRVKDNFAELGYPIDANNVALVKGMLQDTLIVNQPVSLAHIDVDWYEPVKVCLERIYPQLSVHGAMIVDDYQDWSGCRAAVDEYFEQIPADTYEFVCTAGSLIIRKTLAS